jgi:integrase
MAERHIGDTLMALTAAAIKSAKPEAVQFKLTDSGGLHLLVRPNGGRYWRMNYRFNGKHKTLAFGVWPDVTLADARAKRDAARRLIASGVDPAAKAKQDKVAASVAAANTFEAVAKELLAKTEREGLSAITLKKNRWLIGFITPALGCRPISEITAHELLSVLRIVETRGRHETAKRMRAICSQVFRYAIATARADRDVAADLKGALTVPKVTHRAAITAPSGAGAILRAIESFDGNSITHTALRLLPHVFVRPGELRYAEWADFDLEKAVWTIPAHKTKMRRIHAIPLSRQSLDIIASIETDAGFSSYLFPSLRSAHRPMSENTINAALRRLGYAQDEMTGHGIRTRSNAN